MAVAYSVSSASAKNGADALTFTVKRTGTKGELGQPSQVQFETDDVTAKAGSDYVATSGTLDFPANATAMPVEVGIISAAYSSKAVLTFLLKLDDYGDAAGSIIPEESGENTQIYLYVPEDDTTVTVPTKDHPGTNLPHQAVPDNFSDPPDGQTVVDRPLAYLRLGYARADMNYYERVIVDTDTYHPKWRAGGDAAPVEPGAMTDFMLPRAVNRISETASDAEKGNAHLDGVLIYSDRNYNVTVGGRATTVVQGDYVFSVEGTGRLNWKDRKAEWVFDGGSNAFRVANGVTKINGQTTSYDITSIRKFKVLADQEIAYNFGARYSASADAKMTITNAAQYDISNSVKLEVKGPQIHGQCDFKGNFELRTPIGNVTSTRAQVGTVATQQINLSIQAGIAKGWTAAVAAAANANALAAAAVTAGVPAATFRPDSEFYSLATPANLDTEYGAMVGTVVPETCAGLAAVTAGILVAAAVAQSIAAEAPDPMPKIEMTPDGLTLSVGPQSFIRMNDMDVLISAPNVTVAAQADLSLSATGEMQLESPGVSVEATTFNVVGEAIMEDITCDDVNAADIIALSVDTA